ncbi:MAG: hypothetical protein ACI9EF_002229 [Pseudohongiellaceae bacterium]|jgi:hypothetical protein
MRLATLVATLVASLICLAPLTAQDTVDDAEPALTVVERIQAEAQLLADSVTSDLAWTFLSETQRLPAAEARTVHWDHQQERYLSQREFEALSPSPGDEYTARELSAETYYDTKYGTPVAYSRAIEVLGATGLEDLHGAKILDYGYGTIGHLRLLALSGAKVVGVDVDSFLPALYSEPGDQGPVATIDGPTGDVKLVDGSWPASAETLAAVGTGYDLFLSKNTLKRGYIHPAREVDPSSLIDMGVDDATYLSHLSELLNPGGLALIYNICPPQGGADEPYVPWADGRSPFTEQQWQAAGFELLAFDVDDTEAVRDMGELLGWGDATEMQNFFAWYTLARRGDSLRADTFLPGG